MYICYEAARAEIADKNLYNWHNLDAMGYADTEAEAMEWVAKNPDYRAYRYCPKKKVA